MTSLLQAQVERLADARQPHALAVFDLLEEWFHSCDFDCCSAMGTLTGWRSSKASGDAGLGMETLERYAEQAGSPNPREAGQLLQILMMGAILSAGSGDSRAAAHARLLAELLLEA